MADKVSTEVLAEWFMNGIVTTGHYCDKDGLRVKVGERLLMVRPSQALDVKDFLLPHARTGGAACQQTLIALNACNTILETCKRHDNDRVQGAYRRQGMSCSR